MSTHKYFDKICGVVLVLTLVLTGLFTQAESFGVVKAETVMGYESKLFDTSRVHTLDIVMDDWEGFLANCTDEEYVACNVVIDGDAVKNVGIRAKGNTSLSQVAQYGNNRYSFKIEFDHYESGKSYYGLDKLCLNNIIQDNTYMKDYLTFQMMGSFGVASPLTSFVQIRVNGEEWGLYLALEDAEEAFLQRNYGKNYGKIYKPESMSMGGGKGDGGRPDNEGGKPANEGGFKDDMPMMPEGEMPFGEGMPMMPEGEMPFGESIPDMPQGEMSTAEGMQVMPEGEVANREMKGDKGGMGGGMGMMGGNDVSLIYTDDDYDNYTSIFEKAKVKITDKDKDRLIAALKNLNEMTDLENTVDIEAVIRYFVVHNFVVNFDSYTGSIIHNYYLYEDDGQMQMIPWDYNLAFGGFMSNSSAETLINYPIDSPVSGGTIESRPMLAWIFSDDTYLEQYHELFGTFIEEWFVSGKFEAMIDEVEALIDPYVASDPTKFCTYEAFKTGIATLKTFCTLRAESIQGQLDGTIGSTSDAQKDKTNFVQGDGISIADMGSMNMGGMGGGPGGGGMDGRGGRNRGEQTQTEPTDQATQPQQSAQPQAPTASQPTPQSQQGAEPNQTMQPQPTASPAVTPMSMTQTVQIQRLSFAGAPTEQPNQPMAPQGDASPPDMGAAGQPQAPNAPQTEGNFGEMPTQPNADMGNGDKAMTEPQAPAVPAAPAADVSQLETAPPTTNATAPTTEPENTSQPEKDAPTANAAAPITEPENTSQPEKDGPTANPIEPGNMSQPANETAEQPNADATTGASESSEANQHGAAGGEMRDMNMRNPGERQTQSTTVTNEQKGGLLLGSLAVLIVGLGIAIGMKGKN